MPLALGIAGALALINLMWIAVDHLILKGHRDLILPPIIYSVAVAALVATMLKNYDLLTGYGTSLFLEISNLVVPGGSGAQTKAVGSMGSQLTNITMAALKAAFESIGALGHGWSLGGLIMTIVDLVFTLIIGLFCMVIAILMFVSVVSSLFTGTIMAGVAIALGPLFIATLVCDFTKPFFDRWFGFFCSALFIKVIVMTMLSLLLGMLQVGNLVAGSTNNGMGFSWDNAYSLNTNGTGYAFGTLLTLAVALWIMKQLMDQAPEIASALMPGGLGAKVKGAIGPAAQAAGSLIKAGMYAATGNLAGAAKSATQAAGQAAESIGMKNSAGKGGGSSPNGGGDRRGPPTPPPPPPTPGQARAARNK